MEEISTERGFGFNPVAGGVFPLFGQQQQESSDAPAEEPKKAPFSIFNPLDFGKKKEKEPEKKSIDPHELRRAMFALGVSLVDINVKSSGDAGPKMKMFDSFPPLRHGLYASAISDGATNYIAGIVYALYNQSKTFGTSMYEGEMSSVEILGAMAGICIQSTVYCCYGLFSVPIIMFKLSNVDKEDP
ncbi:hypothetical protein DSO57_1020353 [Entomophthora muscae]|uniref:Uncharacterized protein n=1 Tax=Entomophthora muscae TaxID=34485 RepID=A0ACC2U1I9_9FUNG|nr:hypothetical protein DSO57_1020353 [Entomophthora muscae]